MCKTEFRKDDEQGSLEGTDSINGEGHGKKDSNGENYGGLEDFKSAQVQQECYNSFKDTNCNNNKRPSILSNVMSTSCKTMTQNIVNNN